MQVTMIQNDPSRSEDFMFRPTICGVNLTTLVCPTLNAFSLLYEWTFNPHKLKCICYKSKLKVHDMLAFDFGL